MNDDYWKDLAKRWEALRIKELVRWEEGMQRFGTHNRVGYEEKNVENGWWCLDVGGNEVFRMGTAPQMIPVLNDPATFGVLLSQWREACGNSEAYTVIVRKPGWTEGHADGAPPLVLPKSITSWRAYPGDNDVAPGIGETESEAIIAALEAL